MKPLLLLYSLFILLAFSNCATIASYTRYPFSITTNPTGAQVVLDKIKLID